MSPLVWLVTGCSSGFGEQFVKSVLTRGDKVIATARKVDKLEHLRDTGVAILELDVTDSAQNVRTIVSQAIGTYGKIDVLVNNAGYIAIGTWEDLQYENWLTQFNTNFFGTIKVTQALLPHLRERRTGTIVFISSLSGWVGHASCSAYAASKFALEGAVEGLSREIAQFGTRVLLIEPGRFRTKLLSMDNTKAATATIPDYEDHSRNMLNGLAQENQSQPGDPRKLVEVTLNLVRGEGVARGRRIPLRMPLGPDCFDEIKSKCEETLETLEDWKDVIHSTDYDR